VTELQVITRLCQIVVPNSFLLVQARGDKYITKRDSVQQHKVRTPGNHTPGNNKTIRSVHFNVNEDLPNPGSDQSQDKGDPEW